jgi:hypothetical protein
VRRNLRLLKLAASKHYGMTLTDSQAARVLEADDSLAGEIGKGGEMDTLPRDDLGDAILSVIMPGPPTVQDDLIGETQNRWHWPCLGSGDEYRKAFAAALKAALTRHDPPPNMRPEPHAPPREPRMARDVIQIRVTPEVREAIDGLCEHYGAFQPAPAGTIIKGLILKDWERVKAERSAAGAATTPEKKPRKKSR